MHAMAIQKEIDSKLDSQFVYFYHEFAEAATSSGFSIPYKITEIVEDSEINSSGQIYEFIKDGGIKNILQTMTIVGNAESSFLPRCSLSLLIVTIVFLRQKLPENFLIKKAFSNSSQLTAAR